MDLLEMFLAQMSALPTVWMPFLIALVVASIVIWKAVQWQYSVPLAHKDSEIAALKNALELNRETSIIAISGSDREPTPEKPPSSTNRTETKNQEPPAKAGPPDKLEVVDFDEIKRAYREDNLRAQGEMARHVGKWVSYSGVIRTLSFINDNISGVIDDSADPSAMPYVIFTISPNEEGALDLKPKDKIGLIARIRAIDATAIALHDCRLDPLFR